MKLGTASEFSASSDITGSCQNFNKLKWMAHGPAKSVLTYQSYKINSVIFSTKDRDEIRVIQNSGVSIVAKTMQVSSAKDKNPIESDMVFYGVIREIWELDYAAFRVVVFKCDWVENNNGVRVDDLCITLVNFNRLGYKLDQFILGIQAQQVFYVRESHDSVWSVVLPCPYKEFAEFNKSSESGNIPLNHQSFTKGLPAMDLNDDADDSELPVIREDCDDILLDI